MICTRCICLALVRQRLIPSTGGVPAGRGGSDIGNRLHQPTPSPLPGGDTIPGESGTLNKYHQIIVVQKMPQTSG